jgi:hypothetical protein
MTHYSVVITDAFGYSFVVLKLGPAQEENNTVEWLWGGVGEYMDTKSWRSGIMENNSNSAASLLVFFIS